MATVAHRTDLASAVTRAVVRAVCFNIASRATVALVADAAPVHAHTMRDAIANLAVE